MGSVTPIRKGITIPACPTEDDEMTAYHRRVALGFLADIGNNEGGLSDQQMRAIGEGMLRDKIPRNNLRLIVQPISPREEWFTEMHSKARVASIAHDLAESQWSLAYHLDQYDGGQRHLDADRERERTRKLKDLAILDALRTPATRLWDVRRKQDMVGSREWALKYRPEMQAIIDEEEARLRATRKPRAKKERIRAPTLHGRRHDGA